MRRGLFSESARLILAHLRIGYVAGLLAVDLVLLITAYVDIRLKQGAWRESLLLPRLDLSVSGGQSLALFLVLSLLVPLLLASVKLTAAVGGWVSTTNWRGEASRRFSAVLRRRGTRIAIGHIALSAVVSYLFLVFLDQIQLRGSAQSHSGWTPLLQSGFVWGCDLLLDLWKLVPVSLFGPLAQLIVEAMAKRPRAFWRNYIRTVHLTDLGGDLYPLYGRGRGNFNAPITPPEIKRVRRRAQALLAEYTACMPGSSAAVSWLNAREREAEDLIRELLLPPNRGVVIDLLPSTSRALEVCLDRLPGQRRIVLSPLEHPVEYAVARWATAKRPGDDVVALSGGASLVSERSDHVAERLAVQFEGEVGAARRANQRAVLVISEVCWATGQELPINQVLARLAEEARKNAVVVVDGAHAPGNALSLGALDCADFYVTSAHKWLCCPEPCGILIVSNDQEHERPYDAWRRSVPDTWSSGWAICSLVATLEMWRDLGVPNLIVRSRRMREAFEEYLGHGYRVVGSDSDLRGTSMLAIRPAPGFQWVEEPAAFLARRGYAAAAVSLGDPVSWLRVAFSFFLEVQEVRSLCRTLRSAVKEG